MNLRDTAAGSGAMLLGVLLFVCSAVLFLVLYLHALYSERVPVPGERRQSGLTRPRYRRVS